MLLAVVFAAALLDAAPATQPAPAATDTAAKAKQPEMVCRMEEVLGTRFKKKVCVTKEQEELQRSENRQDLERIQSQNGGAHY